MPWHWDIATWSIKVFIMVAFCSSLGTLREGSVWNLSLEFTILDRSMSSKMIANSICGLTSKFSFSGWKPPDILECVLFLSVMPPRPISGSLANTFWNWVKEVVKIMFQLISKQRVGQCNRSHNKNDEESPYPGLSQGTWDTLKTVINAC